MKTKYRIKKHVLENILDESKIKPYTYYTIEKLCWKLWWIEHWTCITNFGPLMENRFTFISLEEAKDLLKKYGVYIKECESNDMIVDTIEI